MEAGLSPLLAEKTQDTGQPIRLRRGRVSECGADGRDWTNFHRPGLTVRKRIANGTGLRIGITKFIGNFARHLMAKMFAALHPNIEPEPDDNPIANRLRFHDIFGVQAAVVVRSLGHAFTNLVCKLHC
jgi:hypothetical protein